MSDSSEEEDLSRFKEAIDSTFVKLINETKDGKSALSNTNNKPSSQRHIEESTHYNDIKVSEELQKRIGAKVSAIINKSIEFVNVEENGLRKRKIKGGVKLFKDSENFLSCEEVKDVSTELHNLASKKTKRNKKYKIYDNIEEPDEMDKINSAVVTSSQVLSKEDTKHWQSRRKEKIFKYKSNGKSKVLTAVE